MMANERAVDETDMADQNLKEKTPHTARMAHDQALGTVMQLPFKDIHRSTSNSSRMSHSGVSLVACSMP